MTRIRVAVLVCVMWCGAFLPAAAATISFTPHSPDVAVGGDVPVDLRIDGLDSGTGPSLGVYDLDVTFDSLLLAFVDMSWGDQLDLFGLGGIRFATPGAGTINLFELSLDAAEDLDSLQAGSFVLATLRFTALSAGSASLGALVAALGDANGNALEAVVQNGAIRVTDGTDPEPTPVPEPGTLLLVGTGALLTTMKRRRHDGVGPMLTARAGRAGAAPSVNGHAHP